MSAGITHLVDLWKEGYSNHIENYKPYQAVEQLKHIAALFIPGEFFYFILNMHNLELEYVHPGVQQFIDVDPKTASIENLLSSIDPDDVETVKAKELLLKEFMENVVPPTELPSYKMLYMYRIKDRFGKYRTMLLQVNVLSVSEKGTIEHILSVHTDISFMGVQKTDTVSFVHLNGGKSFYDVNINSDKLFFEEDQDAEDNLDKQLTKREIEIIQLSSRGYSVHKIAYNLNITESTVRTHRKNMLKKTQYSSMRKLVTKCLMEGII
ncbi:LuxR C-terminal-related transcriptional regulator [Echinicola marina]|uniref:response regulator transcription factor n=1 Tax=Echinicola marina TaxID=2859768 RepID=UPI001CF6CEC5|nr:LuxR C-terminal-related transcriptional regulator [Echinicola marina]UCS94546.1 LuxR C-terminal-related transcriptional regulator [Echinicola marina]